MKKLLPLALLLPLVVGLTGCGKSIPDTDATASSTPRIVATPNLPAPVQTPDVRPSRTATPAASR